MNYDLSNIDFLSLVQFRKDYKTANLTTDLNGVSDSGLYYNSGLVTLDNIYSLMPQVSEWVIADYVDGTTYVINDVVEYDSKYYISLVNANKENQPDTSTDDWK